MVKKGSSFGIDKMVNPPYVLSIGTKANLECALLKLPFAGRERD